MERWNSTALWIALEWGGQKIWYGQIFSAVNLATVQRKGRNDVEKQIEMMYQRSKLTIKSTNNKYKQPLPAP